MNGESLRLSDGRLLAWMESGDADGAPVVLFHGSPGSRLFVPTDGAAEAHGVRLITFDRAGYGGSDAQPGRTVLDTAPDVEALLDHLDIERAMLIGWSGGCPFATATAFALGPARISSLVLVSGPGPLEEVPGGWDALGEQRGPTATMARAGDSERAAHAVERAMAPFVLDPVAFLGTGRGPDAALTRAPGNWEMLQAQIVEGLRPGAEGIAADLVAMWLPFGFALADVGVPARVFHGALDRDNASDTRTYAEQIPGSSLTVWPDLGHFAILARFAEVLAPAGGAVDNPLQVPFGPMSKPHPIDERIEQLDKLKEEALHAGSAAAVQRQHDRGKLTARERIEKLLDPGSFHELDMLARHRAHGFGIESTRPLTDGVVTGWGTVGGRKVFLFSQDFTIFGGALGEVFAEKIHKVMDLAASTGAPFIGINDGAGARIQEGVVSLDSYGGIFHRNVQNSGVIPQISVIMGPCAGGAVYSPAMTDFIFMVKDTSYMFITGPDVVKAATGEDVTQQELGGAITHATKSGVATFSADDEEHCIEMVQYLLSFLPSNNLEDPPYFAPTDDPERSCDAIMGIMPDSTNKPYDMKDIVIDVVDDGDFFEVFPVWAKNIICGFARIDGHVVGIVGNQPKMLAGSLDIDAAEKAARFVRTCDAFNIPIVTFVDVPGFIPGTHQEHGGIIRHGAKLLYAYCEATVPRISIITRKGYGGAYVVMNSKSIGADLTYAWPSAEIAVMDANGAASIIFRREIAEAADATARKAELVEEYAERFANPYAAAERGFVDDVIDPRDTRRVLVHALDVLRSKKENLPARKHGNGPL